MPGPGRHPMRRSCWPAQDDARADEVSNAAPPGSALRLSGHLSELDLDDKPSQSAVARLHDEVAAHVSSRLPWMQAWRTSHPEWRPWILAFLDGGEIRAVAPLARRQRAGIVEVRCIGHTGLDHSPVVCRTARDAVTLAEHLADGLHRLAGPWALDLVRLPSDSAFTGALTRQLRVSEVRSDTLRPIVEFDRAGERHSILSELATGRGQGPQSYNARRSHAGHPLDKRPEDDRQPDAGDPVDAPSARRSTARRQPPR